jgi:methyl-accepting chemotaxis protein
VYPTERKNVRNQIAAGSIAIALIAIILLGILLSNLRHTLVEERKQGIKNLVDIVYTMTTSEYIKVETGEVSEEHAKEHVMEFIKVARYDDRSGYFWVNDSTPKIIIHPIEPQLKDKNISKLKDSHGNLIFEQMLKSMEIPEGIFISYWWGHPTNKDIGDIEKISFVRYFEPWGWIIGTGLYINDINSDFYTFLFLGILGICGIIGIGILVFVTIDRKVMLLLDRYYEDLR